MNEIVRRHESLRTIFRNDEGQPVQLIVPKLELPLPVTVRTGLSPEAREDEIKRFAREQALQPFDLSKGPLLRVSLLQLAEDEHVLVIILHHIVGDGWSGTLLAREMDLLSLCESFHSGQHNESSRLRPAERCRVKASFVHSVSWSSPW